MFLLHFKHCRVLLCFRLSNTYYLLVDCEETLTLVSQNDEAPVTSQDDQTTQSEDDDLDSTQMASVGSGSDTERQKDAPSKITMNNILEKQYKILTLEETKLKLEIQKLEL